MLSKSFNAGKCKTSLKLAVARIKLLKNKRQVQVKQMRRELAQLLEAGQEQSARIRVEHVIREEKTMSAYDLIELYCELIVARLPIIESQKSCPIDLKEAIASVIFASPRCADIPELMDIRKRFMAKYGKEFINAALEVRPDCGVSRLVVEKLSARAPDVETKIKILTAIAQEHNVQWDSNAFEEQLQKPNDDLLNGPNTFASASKMLMESSTAKSSPSPNTSGPFTSQPESRVSESRSEGGEVNNIYSREENASLNHMGWKMEFKDATSAAQAAAESAERASMAARAAAELASRENISWQHSTGSSSYGIKDDSPHKLEGSRLKGEHNVKKSVTKANDEPSRMKPEVQNLHRDEVVQGISRRESGTIYDDFSSVSRSPSRSPSHSSGTYLNDDVLEVNIREADVKEYGHARESYSESEPMEQNRENRSESIQENISMNYSKATASAYAASTFDEDSIWANIHKHENDVGDHSTVGAGEGISGSSHKQPISRRFSAVAFDDYDSDTDDINSVFGRNKGLDSFLTHQGGDSSRFPPDIDVSSPKQHRSGSLVQNTSSQLHFVAEHSETMTKANLSSQSVENLPATFDDSDGLSTEDEDAVDNSSYSTHKEAMRPSSFLHAQRSSMREESSHGLNNIFFKEKKEVEETNRNYVPAVSSDSYKKNHEADSISADKFGRRSGSSSLLDNQPSAINDKDPRNLNDSRRGLYDSSTDEEEPLHSSKAQSTEEAETMGKLGMASSSFGNKDSEFTDELSYGSGQGLNFGRLTGGLKHRGFQRPPYVRSAAVDASPSSKQTSVDTSITEEPIVSHLEKPAASFDVPNQERYRQESRPDLQFPAQESYNQRLPRNDYKESSLESPVTYFDPDSNEQPRYTVDSRRYRDGASTSPKQSSDASPDIDKPTAAHRNKKFASSEVLKQEVYDKKPHMKAYKESKPITYSDLDGDDSELEPHHIVGNTGNKGVQLSRRTREKPSQAKTSSFSRFAGHSDVPVTSETESKPTEASSAPEPLSNTTRRAINLQGKGSSKSLQSNQSAEQLYVESIQTQSSTSKENLKSQLNSTESVVPTNNQNPKPSSSSGNLASRESSLKNASHIHPKLPDYDSLAAHFHSLRSNRS